MYVMEKSLVKTDQINALAAAVTAIKPAIPARLAVSARRSGDKETRRPVASNRRATEPASKLYAANARAIKRERLPKVAILTPIKNLPGRMIVAGKPVCFPITRAVNTDLHARRKLAGTG